MHFILHFTGIGVFVCSSFVLRNDQDYHLSFLQVTDLFIGGFVNLSKTGLSDKYHADNF